MLRSIVVVLFLVPYVLIASPVGYLLARLTASPRVLYALGRFAVRTALRLAGTQVVFEGLEPLLRDPRNVVVMPNHESNLDAPILFGLVPIDFKAIYKREIDRFPFLKYALHFAGLIDVDRNDKADARRALARATDTLRRGHTLVIFPEGTRSHTGELGPFKKGGFVVAMDAKSRIFPVAIKGARALMPRGGFAVRPGTVRVRVLDPVDAAAYSYDDRELLRELIRERIAAELRQGSGPVTGGA